MTNRKNVTLYKLTHTRLLSWSATADENQVVVEHGEYKGKQQVDIISFESPYEAEVELCRRIAIKKTKQGYTAEVPLTVPDLPMLASDYNPSKLSDPIYAQPKLDGIRCVGSCSTMLTRRGEPIVSVPHITEALSFLPPGIRLDGELYCHGKSFQEHLSLIKRDSPHPQFSQVKYNVFDIQIPDMPFEGRMTYFFDIVDRLESQYVITVPTYWIAKSSIETMAKELFKEYEGAILRNPLGLYEHNRRSENLQKYKKTESAECQIVNVIAPSSGRTEGCAIFICRHPVTGQQFKVVPKMEHYLRRTYFQDKEAVIGYWTRVTYETLSAKGVPLKPRAEGVAYRPENLQ